MVHEAKRPSFIKWLIKKLKALPKIERPLLQGYIGFIIIMGSFVATRLYYLMSRLWMIWIPLGLLSFLYGIYLIDTALN